MQIILGAILILTAQGSLDSYHLQMDPQLLDSLYSDPFADYQLPAFIETEAGACSCLAGFRGGSSLWSPKLSWKIELFDTSIENASHILLDAHYRDLSLMRNALGLLLSRKLGRPTPLTVHVEFYVNGEYYGVYVQVERIDEYFFHRTGIGNGPVFKSVDDLGRFAWQPSDTLGTTGFESKRGSAEYLPLLRQLIDAVNLFSPLSFSFQDFIANAAVSLAINDTDAISKNYYLHLNPLNEWRYYPWDRDASFGNSWEGIYNPDWTGYTSMNCFRISAMASRLLLQNEYRDMFEDYMLQTGEIMRHELPDIIDSIYAEIRESVYADPFKQGSNEDFDEAVAILREAVSERGAFLPEIARGHLPLEVVSMTLSDWEFEPGGYPDSVKVSIEYAQPVDNISLVWWSDGEEKHLTTMYPDDASMCRWSRTINFPAEYGHIKFSVKAGSEAEGGVCHTAFYYPLYAPPTSFSPRRVCAPTARRSIYSFDPVGFEVLAPVRYTVFLWSLPVINTSNSPQDISFCGFQAGDPPARLFASEQTVIDPGDTLYITNNAELLSDMMPYNTVLGNLALTSPSNSEFLLLDPSWQTALTVTVKEEVNCNESSSTVILSEICFDGDSGDWIELFNTGLFRTDISGNILIDGQNNEISLPANTIINPGRFLVVCEDEQSFRSVNGYDIEVIEGMNFGLNNEKDGVSLLENDRLIFSVMYDAVSWPLEDNHVLSLSSPELPLSNSLSWQAIELPGTPGRPNPGWPAIILRPVIETLWPNPVSASFNLNYIIPSIPAELLLYDIAGRLVLQPQHLINLEGSFSCDLPPSLPPGVYFAVIRSCGTSASRKFVLLP